MILLTSSIGRNRFKQVLPTIISLLATSSFKINVLNLSLLLLQISHSALASRYCAGNSLIDELGAMLIKFPPSVCSILATNSNPEICGDLPIILQVYCFLNVSNPIPEGADILTVSSFITSKITGSSPHFFAFLLISSILDFNIFNPPSPTLISSLDISSTRLIVDSAIIDANLIVIIYKYIHISLKFTLCESFYLGPANLNFLKIFFAAFRAFSVFFQLFIIIHNFFNLIPSSSIIE